MSSPRVKTVSFSVPLCTIFYVIDTLDHVSARKRHWENFVVDRQRFVEKCENFSLTIQPAILARLSRNSTSDQRDGRVSIRL